MCKEISAIEKVKTWSIKHTNKTYRNVTKRKVNHTDSLRQILAL